MNSRKMAPISAIERSELTFQVSASPAWTDTGRATQSFELEKISALTQFFDYAREGVWHIWIGFDRPRGRR